MEKTIEDLEKELKSKDATIEALKGMIHQLVPVVEAILPLLKERPELDKEMLAQIERMTQVANMLAAQG